MKDNYTYRIVENKAGTYNVEYKLGIFIGWELRYSDLSLEEARQLVAQLKRHDAIQQIARVVE